MMRSRQGQAMVEFTLVATLFLLVLLAIIDFSWLFTVRTQTFQAARAGARYAAVHPTAWSNAPNPSNATIEGQLRANLSTTSLPNDDAHIAITYWVPGSGSSETECGHYSATSNRFVPAGTYTQGTCLLPGTLIQVQATYTYTFITPLLKATLPGPSITALGAVMEEV
jgi:Flp pilus assembly protein TadG